MSYYERRCMVCGAMLDVHPNDLLSETETCSDECSEIYYEDPDENKNE